MIRLKIVTGKDYQVYENRKFVGTPPCKDPRVDVFARYNVR